ncbi:MAG TPA: TRAP transporter small permease subunit [Ramlibacter sp.]|uniref:TRAP transporter small permease n=1 Tax=Ramlibacter sp. TaxID=1917967 RepID=UPI002C892EED|nr:TRAP transporter small permease subunit [Ramlibacter sp.]HVZ42654.1 TRAP transporter small permease subunit [Ramlibacter sp.]
MRQLAWVVSAVLIALMTALILVITAQIVWRFFGSPLTFSLEVSRILFLWITFLGAALAVHRGQFTALEMLSRRLPRWWSERVICGVVCAFALVLAWHGTLYVARQELGTFTMTGLPMTIVYVAPAVSGVLMFVFAVGRLVSPPAAGAREGVVA